MHLKKILPAIVLFTSACAQVPSTPEETALQTGTPMPAATGQPPKSQPPIARVQPQRVETPPEVTTAAAAPITAPAPKLRSAPPGSVWERIERGYGLAPMDNELVQRTGKTGTQPARITSRA